MLLSVSRQLGTSHNLQVSCRLASPPVIFAIVLASIFLFIFSIISSSRILSALHSYMSPNITTCIIVHSCKSKTELCKEHGATLHYGTDAILPIEKALVIQQEATTIVAYNLCTAITSFSINYNQNANEEKHTCKSCVQKCNNTISTTTTTLLYNIQYAARYVTYNTHITANIQTHTRTHTQMHI